jgi:hypothetical protein
MSYIAVEGTSAGDLTNKVNQYIKDGHKPIGGIAITIAVHTVSGKSRPEITKVYCQAMVKE